MRKGSYCSFCGNDKSSIILSTNSFAISQCKNCKIAFTNPPPIVPDYSNMDFHSKADAENKDSLTFIENLHPDWQNLIHKQKGLISSHYDYSASILEIGCGEGILLFELKKSGFKNIEGIEPSKYAAIRGQKKDLKISNIFFESSVIEEKFDLIIMSHVFEHIEDPQTFLQNVSKVLKEDGSILFTQTNYKGLIPRLQKEKWYAWVPEQHFWHFTLSGLTKFMELNNFNLIDYKYTSLVHPHNFLYKVATLKDHLIDQFIALYKCKND